MKDELGRRIMKKFVELRAKTYSYLIDDGSENKKAKGTKNCVIKKLKFEDYKNSLEAAQLKNKINHLQKNKIDTDILTEQINKIAVSSNDDKRIQSIDLIETYAYGTSKDLKCKKEENECNNAIKQYFDYITKEDIKKHKPNLLQIPDHHYRILIVVGSGSGRTNALLNLISHQPDIDKIYLYAKDPYEVTN